MQTIKQFFIAAWLLAGIACSKSAAPGGSGTNPPPPPPATPLINPPQGWKLSTSLTGSFPQGIQLYMFDSIYAGRPMRAFCLAYDSRQSRFEFKPVLSATAKRPSEFFRQETGIVFACINGGFFGGNQSFSTVKYNNVVASPNIKSVNRMYNGISVPYYPTRAAFGISSTGAPSASWVYHVGAGNDSIYSYPVPVSNTEGNLPQPVPTPGFPSGGSLWNAVSAIGGSPMLLRGGQLAVTDAFELINVNNTSPRPRSAIGHTLNNIVLLVAVEGDNTVAGRLGLSLNELAQLLQELGCTDAINLDGGGSTSLIVGNLPTVRPGDNGVERPVVSAVLIKQK